MSNLTYYRLTLSQEQIESVIRRLHTALSEIPAEKPSGNKIRIALSALTTAEIAIQEAVAMLNIDHS